MAQNLDQIYLDYNATTPLAREVSEKMTETLTSVWGNPSSGYKTGVQAKVALESARENVAHMLGAAPADIIFTSGGTEANNIVIFGILQYFEDWHKTNPKEVTSRPGARKEKPHVITTNVEHDAILLPIKHLQQAGKIDATFVPVKRCGSICPIAILSEIRPSTCLITVMLANNETGVVMPLEKIANGLKAANSRRASENLIKILLHSDAAQAIGKIPFYGPRGGCLFAREPVYPMMFGGQQERGLRPGTENVAVAVGLGCAAELVSKNLDKYSDHFQRVRIFLEDKLKEEFAHFVRINFRDPSLNFLPNTCSVTFLSDVMTGSEILKGCAKVEASVGAACHKTTKPSAILIASGLTETEARSTLRLSIGRETTEDQITAAVADIRQ
ncbi:hypothetical protein B566_EDAN006228, partial [Ephemera danica]